MLIPLHVKSHYSLARGTASIESLVERAAAAGLPALALTDHESLAGQIHFHDLCRRHGVRPITGLELPSAELSGAELPSTNGGVPAESRGRIVLLARDAAGYRSLCRIIARRHAGGGSEAEQRAAHDPVAAIARHSEGLIVMTDHGPTLARLGATADIERTSLRALLVRPSSTARQRGVLEVAAAHRINLVADPEIVLLDRHDQMLHLLRKAIAKQVTVAALGTDEDQELQRWMRSPRANDSLFSDVPKALEEANRIASRCTLELGHGDALLPGAEAFSGAQPAAELERRCRAALEHVRSQGRCRQPTYEERLAGELEVIGQLGYAGYFLAAAEITDEARRRGIAVALRGSAAGSLVVHLLGISDIDPLPRGLFFERFLHFGRQQPPDIDLDVCSQRRDELIRWAYRRFGRDRVAMAGVYQSFGVATAFRAGLKALGASRADIDHFASALERRGLTAAEHAGTRIAPPDAEAAELSAEATELSADAGDLPLTLLPAAQQSAASHLLRLVGLPRRLALHPGGLLIGDTALEARVPVERANRNLTVAQYDLRALEAAGIAKLDLLGNRFLGQLTETLTLAGRVPDPGGQWGAELPLDDGATLERIERADTVGCYQIETPPMRALLARMPVERIEDLVAALALVRPGAGAETQRRYIRRLSIDNAETATEAEAGESDATMHPATVEHLAETHGLLLYDEDLMSVLSGLAGISLAAADEIRAAIIDADPDELERLEDGFVELVSRRGRDDDVARAAWRSIAPFASYTFCKAHAWSYAVLAYRSAYLKSHYPHELACALLNDYGGAYPLRTVAADVARAGVRLLPPSVKDPELASTPRRDAEGRPVAVRVGLDKVKHLTRKHAEALCVAHRQRPFAAMADVLERVPLSRRELRALVLCGACDGLPPLSASAYPFAHEHFLHDPSVDDAGPPETQSSDLPEANARQLHRYAALVRVRNELDLLGMHLSDHPLRLLRDDARRHGCLDTAEIRARARAPGAKTHERGPLRFAGIIAASRRHRPCGSRSRMQFLTFEDEHGLLEAVIRPSGHELLAPRVTTPGPYLVEGQLENDLGHAYVNITSLHPFHERAHQECDQSPSIKHSHGGTM